MSFFDREHQARIDHLEKLWEALEILEDYAQEYGINDILQDNGAKVLQQLVYLDMEALPGREGNDGIDENGVEWEMKSINVATSAQGFSTHHHLNRVILEKYRKVPWSFAIYEDITLREIYVLSPEQMLPMYEKWEDMLKTRETINNPKIPIKFVRESGTLVFPFNYRNPVNPAAVVQGK